MIIDSSLTRMVIIDVLPGSEKAIDNYGVLIDCPQNIFYIPSCNDIEFLLSKGSYELNINLYNFYRQISDSEDLNDTTNFFKEYNNLKLKLFNSLSEVFINRYFRDDDHDRKLFNNKKLTVDEGLENLESNFNILEKDFIFYFGHEKMLKNIYLPNFENSYFTISCAEDNENEKIHSIVVGNNSTLDISCCGFPDISKCKNIEKLSIDTPRVSGVYTIDNAKQIYISDRFLQPLKLNIENAERFTLSVKSFEGFKSGDVYGQVDYDNINCKNSTIDVIGDWWDYKKNTAINNINAEKLKINFLAGCGYYITIANANVENILFTSNRRQFIYSNGKITINKLIIENNKNLTIDYEGDGIKRSADVSIYINDIDINDDNNTSIIYFPKLMKVFYKGIRLQGSKRIKDQIQIVNKILSRLKKEEDNDNR